MTNQDRQPWQDPWQNLNFLREKMTPRWNDSLARSLSDPNRDKLTMFKARIVHCSNA
jgi:hypothetical protein